MNLAYAQHCVTVGLEPTLARLGFSSCETSIFVRKVEGGILQILSFGVNIKESGGFAFGFGVGIRFEKVEEVIGRSGDGRYKSTIGLPIHLLRGDRQFEEWFFTEPMQLESILTAVIADLRRYAFPFFEKFSSVERVRLQLEMESPKEWFARTPESRMKILAGIIYIQEGREVALKFLSSKLEESGPESVIYKGELLALKKS